VSLVNVEHADLAIAGTGSISNLGWVTFDVDNTLEKQLAAVVMR
jgi:hypothetical protein